MVTSCTPNAMNRKFSMRTKQVIILHFAPKVEQNVTELPVCNAISAAPKVK